MRERRDTMGIRLEVNEDMKTLENDEIRWELGVR